MSLLKIDKLPNGNVVKYWYKDISENKENDAYICLHREDGPAVEYDNGDKEWYYEDKIHRKDGPAIEYENGDEEWWYMDKKHREDGPAIIYNSKNHLTTLP